ncbi:DUF3360 domain-containing protein [Vibrio parahaemolyticus]|uniref:DUF3360 domain-containing protein n=2 Tax=Vibrio parahaemolyticus TaxID=670 RepID=UPI002879DC75|nr:DUF3360 domain-containing protein [Vibrio parahaemolyticus]MBE3678912.1 DUF3360 domain-containing protein [Vibrio parahaemolyticus]MDS1995483.1 DUF3360 domain-containing protein [Vibrio parahaemolyticus]
MSDSSKTFYRDVRKKPHEFESREDFLNHDLTVMSFRRWGIHLPSRDYSIEIEDWVPALAATIGKVVMVTAMVAAFAAQFGLSPEFVAENVRYELLIAGALFVILFSAILNPNANLAGTHGPMIPLIPMIAAAGGHPLALGLMVCAFGLILAFTKGGSKLMTLTGIGVRGGLLIYLGAVGLIGQINKTEAWAASTDQGYISFVVIGLTVMVYAYLAKINKRWLAIPLCSALAGIVAYAMGAEFSFTTEPGLPNFSPFYWWGENTGWQLGWPTLEHFIAVTPFALLAVAMWSPDYLGHRVFQELNYPKEAKGVLMDVDDTMVGASIRQGVGSLLGGGNLASSWGTYMIPAAIAKRPIPGGALLTGLMCIAAAVIGYPMDLAMWEPVLRVALIVGVFLPLLEAGMQMIHKHKDSLSAGICIFACAFVNPVFGWAITMLLDNLGLIGDHERANELSGKDKYLFPGVAFIICAGSLAVVGQLPGIPALIS